MQRLLWGQVITLTSVEFITQIFLANKHILLVEQLETTTVFIFTKHLQLTTLVFITPAR
jgi:hypothetical protein